MNLQFDSWVDGRKS